MKNIRSLLWNGEADEVVSEITSKAQALAPRPDKLTALASRPDAKTLWEHAMYFEKHSGTMKYPEYRRTFVRTFPYNVVGGKRGYPLASGSVESACGQLGDRVKHARMRWTRKGADGIHQVKAAILSQDGRWRTFVRDRQSCRGSEVLPRTFPEDIGGGEKHWPAPIPVLELPSLEELAPAA